MLGEGRDREHALDLVARWQEPGAADAAWERLGRFWDDRLDMIHVDTPDVAMNVMLNRWLLYQALASRMFGRTGFYQSSGAIGFRDQLQDALALVMVEPARCRAHLLDCAAKQFEQGDVLHWWHPPAARGVRTRCSDDLLWLPFAVAHYITATGDATVLDEPVRFLTGRQLGENEDDLYALFESGDQSGTLLEHCERALERGLTHGAHGLPLIGSGDWNDGMNRVGRRGRGESVWLAWFAIAATNAFANVCQQRGTQEQADRWRRRARELAHAAEAHGWDGEWYRRAFDDQGRPWGSRENTECRIDSIAQSWAVISGGGSATRAKDALGAVERELIDWDERLVRLLAPPFSRRAAIPGTSRRIRQAFARMAGSIHTQRSGSGGPSRTWATVNAWPASSICSIRLVMPLMREPFRVIAWSRTSWRRMWAACRRTSGVADGRGTRAQRHGCGVLGSSEFLDCGRRPAASGLNRASLGRGAEWT